MLPFPIKYDKVKTGKLSVTWLEVDTADELDAPDRELTEEAIMASEKAYAPYSEFYVGAAARLDNGMILRATNVENAAFPSGICAERSVIAYAVSNFPGHYITALSIAARTKEGITPEPVTPCGNCRQVIAEEEFRTGKNIRIILSGKERIIVFEKGSDLLPVQFNRNSLRTLLP